MEEEEDVTTNPFFITLKQRHAGLYQLVQSKCYVVCVPQAASLAGTTLSEEFLKLHILASSPYFQGSFTTLSDKSVELEDNHITTTEGFAEQRRIKVLSEELFYNAQSQGFRVLLIERPFIGGTEVTDNHQSILPKERTATAVKYFLDSFPENEIVLQKIDETTGEFNKTYVIVKGFESHVVRKVQELYNYAVEALLCANPVFREFHIRNRNLAEFKEIVEVYVLNRLHAKLWDDFTTLFAKEDNDLLSLASSLKNLRQSDVGVRQALQCSMVAPSRHFKYMDTCTSPLEKLYCLKETCDLIMKTVAASQPPDSQESVTTDDLIPFLVYIIVLSKPKNLRTNLFLMENLTFIGLSTNEMGFNLVSLQAAVQYLRSKELAKFVDAEASDSVFRDNSPLKSLGNAIFTRHSSFFSSPSAAASSADASPHSDSGAGAQSESAVQQEKRSTYRISALTDDDSFPPPAASSSASSHVASSYSLTPVYGSTPSPSSASPSPASHPSPSSAEVSSPSSGGAPPRLHYRSLSSLFPSFGRGGRRADKSDSMPAASFTSSSSSTSSSATSSSRSPYERVSPRSSSSTSSSSPSPSPSSSSSASSVPPLSTSAHSLSSSSSYTGGSRRGGGAISDRTHHGPAHARSSSSATLPPPGSFAAWATPVQRPPAVITLDDVATKKGDNSADDLGDFLTQLQNVKDDALSSQG